MKIRVDLTDAQFCGESIYTERPPKAWRFWRVRHTPEGMRLRSIVANYILGGPVGWNKDRPTIKINRRIPEALGFFSLKPEYVCRELINFMSGSGFRVVSIGEVSLFGRVIEHRKGYRSQGIRIDRVAILRVTFGPEVDDVVEDIESAYRCPVISVVTDNWRSHKTVRAVKSIIHNPEVWRNI